MNLRNPKFGNTYLIDSKAVQFKTLDGEVDFFKNEDWKGIKRFTVSFEALSQEEANQMLSFYQTSAGQEIEFTDHERNIWSGFILDDKPSIIQSGIGCQFQTSFIFEGIVIGVEP